MAKRSFIFPYGISLREGGKVESFPVAEVLFFTQESEWLSLFLVIDSGATISALPASDAEVFGIDASQGTPLFLQGIGKVPTKAWQHTVRARLGDEIMHLPVAFVENTYGPRVLGRAGVFGQFSVVFEEHQPRTGFLGRNTKEARALKIVLDKLGAKDY